jgi:tetratricopeptide (TPR) repeat protein
MAKKPSFLETFKGLAPKKGTKDKEIEKYEKILSEQPDDRNALNALGDLYAKRGDAEKACEYYLRVGGLYAKDGFTLKAIAVYKKAQRAKPDVVQTYIDLADLYVQKGLIGEAKSNYLAAAEMQAVAGAKHESLDIYRKIADLDPTNLNIRSKLAAMYEKENFIEDAATIYTEIGDVVIRQNVEEGKNYYRRAIEIQPDNQNVLSHIGDTYAERAMRKEAAEIFAKLAKLAPNNIDYQQQLDKFLTGTSGPMGVPSEITPITFSEEELTSLNFGEGPGAGLQNLTGLNMEPNAEAEHTLDFPLVDLTSETNTAVQGAEDHVLDFHIEDQGTIGESTQENQSSFPEAASSQAGNSINSLEQPQDFEAHENQVTAHEDIASQADSSRTSNYFDLAARLDTAVKLGREYEGDGLQQVRLERSVLKVEAPENLGGTEISNLIKEFKQGVLEEVGTEDYETHYELGISYKEMSLLDDAIEELKLASLEPSKFVECQGVIGLCYLEKGDYKSAVQAFQEARSKVKPRGGEYQDLTYQIALAYEKAGKAEEAVQEFQRLFQMKPDYRDVKQRLNSLLG